jgi:hypothetical protein
MKRLRRRRRVNEEVTKIVIKRGSSVAPVQQRPAIFGGSKKRSPQSGSGWGRERERERERKREGIRSVVQV